MLRSIHRIARMVALCGAFLALPTLAGAGEWSDSGGSEGGFGSGAVFVGRGGQVNRGVTFGFDEGRGVAVVGSGRSSSFERYEGGRRYESTRSSYRPGGRQRFYDGGAVVIDRTYQGRTIRDVNRARLEARRQQFEDRRNGRSDGSFIRLRDAGRIDRFERDPRYENRRDRQGRSFQGSRTLTTFDVGDWGGGSVVNVYGTPYPAAVEQGPATLSGSVGARILNVQKERLDRRPIGPTGLDVVMTEGGSKIIRIAPGYRLARAEQANRRAAPTRAAAPSDGALGLQPWSTGWLRYCQRTHRSFDADLGTYVTENGRVRFCTAE